MIIPENLLYAETHEWVRIDGDCAVIGITDHAQSQLGDVVFVELPQASRSVSHGEAVAVVESVKAASDIYSPVNGEVIETNQAVVDDPSLINREPYDGGWLFKLRVSPETEHSHLKSADAYRSLL
ncbi:MAG: glycine cleavage system protein GcvH [Verrucomicrobiia bacterium]